MNTTASAKRLDHWLEELDPPEHWLIPGLIREPSRNTLIAEFKAGKTKLVLNITRCVVDGDPFLGELAVNRLPDGETVVLIDFEMSASQLKKWLRIQGIQRTDAVFVWSMRGQDTNFRIHDNHANRADWAQKLKNLNCKLLIIDCLGPALSAMGLTEDVPDIAKFCGALDALLIEADVEYCIVVHHMGHTEARPRGGSNLRGWADAEMLLTRVGDTTTGTRYFAAAGRDVELAKRAIEYDVVTERFTYAPVNRFIGVTVSSMAKRKPSAAEQLLPEIVTLLRASPIPLGVAMIAQLLSQRPQGFSHHVNTVRDSAKLGVARKELMMVGPSNNPTYTVAVP
jgi:hypothetical protein